MRNIYLLLAVAFNVASYLVYKSISHKEANNLWYMIFVFGLMLGGINVLFFTKALREAKAEYCISCIFRWLHIFHGNIILCFFRRKNKCGKYDRCACDCRWYRFDVKLSSGTTYSLYATMNSRLKGNNILPSCCSG